VFCESKNRSRRARISSLTVAFATREDVMGSSTSQFAHPRGVLGWLAGAVMAVENRQRNAFALTLLDMQPGDHVLEIGFGPGSTVRQLATLVGEGIVAGVDSSRVMVSQARLRNADAIDSGRVDLYWGSVASLPFPDAQFDRALAVNSFHHWPEPETNLREVKRVLRPDGVLVIAEQPVWADKAADDCRIASELAAQLTAAGLARVEVITRRMWQAPTIAVRGVKPGQGDGVTG
jgi:SAM-dependent methyltransferase